MHPLSGFNDNWYKLSQGKTAKNKYFQKDCINKVCRGLTGTFTSANISSYLLRYFIIKNSLLRLDSFLFIEDGLNNTKTLSENLEYHHNEEIFSKSRIMENKCVIFPIKSLSKTAESTHALGMLISNEGQILLEDPTNNVKLEININKVMFGKGIYCFNHIVIVKGKMNHLTGNFEVESMFHPPIKKFQHTTALSILLDSYVQVFNLGNISNNEVLGPLSLNSIPRTPNEMKEIDYFGSSKMQISSKVDYWVIISDIPMKNSQVTKNLHQLFSGYERVIIGTETKIGFVLLGNFTLDRNGSRTELNEGESFVYDESDQMKKRKEIGYRTQLSSNFSLNNIYKNFSLNLEDNRECFNELMNLLQKFPTLISKSIFLILPGPNDVGPDLIPKNPFPNYFAPLSKNLSISEIYMTTNPTRLFNNGIDLFIIRHSLSLELKEKALFSYFGKKNMGSSTYWNLDPEALEELIPTTVLGQNHLTPTSSNIIHSLDPSLFLLPTPNIIIIADTCPSFSVKPREELWLINPGSFKNTNSWTQYNVSNDSVDQVWL
ncbi:DNA polymerase epsilon subunit [Cryptosporidium felis]|nr:DNA polymerase epsilon subunit [Cryptosporidium felis]